MFPCSQSMQNESQPQRTSNDNADWDAIGRFVAGESDPAEALIVEAWLMHHPLDAEVVRLVQARAARFAAQDYVRVDIDGALSRVRGRIADETPRLTVVRGGVVGHSSAKATWLRSWRSAAVVAAAGVAMYVGVTRWEGRRAMVDATVFATNVGARDSLTLSDGTHVILAPGSRLTVAAGYGASTREVTLDGAAFFDVQHDARHPFTVRARGTQIRDIGTAFSVNTDASGGVAVAVMHGIVALRDSTAGAASAVELHAGDRGVVRGGAIAVARGIVTVDDIAWTRGHLTYRDAPLTEVQADLQRWYGIDLRVTDATLLQRTVNGTNPGDSAAATVKWIALILGADVVQRGDTVFLQLAGHGTTP